MKKYILIEKIKSALLVFLFSSMLLILFSYTSLLISPTNKNSLSALPSEYSWVFSNTDKVSVANAEKNMLLPISICLVIDKEGFAAVNNNDLVYNLYNEFSTPIENIFSNSYLCTDSSVNDWKNALSLSDFVLIDYGRPVLYPIIPMFFGNSSNKICQGDIVYIEKLILFSDTAGTLKAISKNHDGTYSSFTPLHPDYLPRFDFNSSNLAAYTVNIGFVEFSFNSSHSLDTLGTRLPYEYPIYQASIGNATIAVSNPLYLFETATLESETENSIFKDDTFSNILSKFNVNPNISGVYWDGMSKYIFVNDYTHLEISTNGNISYTVSSSSPNDERAIKISNLIGLSKDVYDFEEIIIASTVFIRSLFESLNLECVPLISKVSTEGELLNVEFLYFYNGTKIVNSRFSENYAAKLTFDANKILKADINLLQIIPSDTINDSISEGEYFFLDSSIIQSAALNLYMSKFIFEDPNPMMPDFYDRPDYHIELSNFIPIYFINEDGIYHSEWTALTE